MLKHTTIVMSSLSVGDQEKEGRSLPKKQYCGGGGGILSPCFFFFTLKLIKLTKTF